MPFDVTRMLVLLFILPHINYGNIVFAGADLLSSARVGMVLRACVRYILCVSLIDNRLIHKKYSTKLPIHVRFQMGSVIYSIGVLSVCLLIY
jgi:hypothetical protein